MLFALNRRIGFQVFTLTTERSSALYVLSPLVGEVYLGTDQGFGRPLSTRLSWLLVSVLWFTPRSLCMLDGSRLPKGTRLMYSRERFTGYDLWFI